MKTVEDLLNAVKRHLTSNVTLVNHFQGDATNSENLVTQIDAAIIEGANNARRFAERVHDFSATEMTGRTILTHGSPLCLDHVCVKKMHSGLAAHTVNVSGLDWGSEEWPEFTIPFAETQLLEGWPNVESVTFAGTVPSGLVAGEQYHVIKTVRNKDLSVTFQIGAKPGELASASGLQVVLNLGNIRRFKTLRQAYLYQTTSRTLVPIETVSDKNESIRRQRFGNRQYYNELDADTNVRFNSGYKAIRDGQYLKVDNADQPFHIAVKGHVWMEDYTELTDTDFILQHGFDFMMWQTIIEVNYMLLKFVARQEGTIAPPEKARDMALDSLILWDSYQSDGNLYQDIS